LGGEPQSGGIAGKSPVGTRMLQINKSRAVAEHGSAAAELVSLAELHTAVVGFVRRQFSVIVFVVLFCLALGAVDLYTAVPRFTGRAVMVIDSHKAQLFQTGSPLGDMPLDSAAVDTQIQIIKSDNIALAVIKDMHLNEDPEFISSSAGLIGTVVGFVTEALNKTLSLILPASPHPVGEPTPEFQLMQQALNTFQSRLEAKRMGLTYAIEIDFQSLSPDRAAQIANAVADAYVVDSLEAKYQTTRRAAIWLQDRLKELREQSTNAERAVVDFKAKNNIVDTGGRLMNEQQLAELNSALIQARASTAEAKARLDRVQQILLAGDLDPAATSTATVTDSLHSEVITKLRQQYLEYDARASDWTKKYGGAHLAVVNLRNQMHELRRTMFEELQRIAETYKSDYEIAKAREESVQKSLAQIVSESQTTNEAQITLHNLDSSAQTYRALYDNFLQRYMESVQQQSFPISETRLITPATRPLIKSSPRSHLILALASLCGLLIGTGVGALREISDRVFRTSTQITDHLQADCITVVPLVKSESKALAKAESKENVSIQAHKAKGAVVRRSIASDRSLHWTMVDSPFSRFSESIRAIKVAADVNSVVKANKVIGITSSLPNEGKSTVAISLTGLIAHGGGRAVLVDCDMRNPSLSRKLAPDAKAGLLEVLAGKAEIDDVLWTEPRTGLMLLPIVLASRLTHSTEILASEATRKLFEHLRRTFDYVIVDLPPLAPVVDVRVMTPLIDSFVFVVEWGRTKIDVAEHALSSARGVHENLLGVVLNKVDMNAFGRYESHREGYYFNRYYARYGYTD
jgi:polysaccharide biosynthesis transport protein